MSAPSPSLTVRNARPAQRSDHRPHPSSSLSRPNPPSRAGLLLVLALFGLEGPASAQSPPASDSVFDPVLLEGFVVTADRMERRASSVAAHTTTLSGADLREAGVRTVTDALRTVPGLTLVQSGSFGGATSIFLRGGESDYVRVLVDGVAVNDPGGAFDLGGLTTADVERIEVVRGPASALYGSDAMAGVIQVFTRRGHGSPRGELALRGGSFGTLDWTGSALGSTGPLSWAVTAGQTDTDGILAFNNRHRSTTVSGQARFQPNATTQGALHFRVLDRRFHFPTDGTGNVVDQNAFTFQDGYTVGATGRRAWTETFSTEVALSLFDQDSGTDDAQDGPADSLGFYGFQSLDRLQRRTADVRTIWSPRPETRVVVGGMVERQDVRSTSESTSEFGVTPGESDHQRSTRAVYAQLAQDGTSTALTGGVRLEDNDRFGQAATFRAGATWQPGPRTRFRVSAGTGIKEPTFFENFATGFAVGNPDLEPERSRSVEAGLDQDLGRGTPVRLSLTAFTQRFRNLIQFAFPAPVEGGPNYHNLAEARSRGMEATLTLEHETVQGDVSYALVDTDVLDAGADEGEGATFVEGERLLRRPTHTWSAGLQGAVGRGISVAGRIRRVGDRADRDFATFPAAPVTLEPYTVVDVSVTAQVLRAGSGRPGFSLSLRLENALDEDYQEVLGFRAPGRGVYLGGSVQFGSR